MAEIGHAPTVYGPVPSWRLGRSLGVDPLPPPKTCTFDCIYCQLGRTARKVSIKNWRVVGVTVGMVVEDLRKALERLGPKGLDYITFSGMGEPTLNPKLGEMIAEAKKLAAGVPVAVLTNSSLLSVEDVRMNLVDADLVVAKLDAPTEALFKEINRPSKGITLKSITDGIKKLREEMKGALALQIMFLHSKDGRQLNSTTEAVEGLIRLAESIMPDEIQVNTPTRPPSEAYVEPLTPEEINEIAARFTDAVDAEVISVYQERMRKWVKKPPKALEEEAVKLIRRRPCRPSDVSKALGITEEEAQKILKKLLKSGLASTKHFHGETYYTTKTHP